MRDSKSKSLSAHVVPSKGIDEKGFAVDSLVEDLKWLGYSKIAPKSGNERFIVKQDHTEERQRAFYREVAQRVASRVEDPRS